MFRRDGFERDSLAVANRRNAARKKRGEADIGCDESTVQLGMADGVGDGVVRGLADFLGEQRAERCDRDDMRAMLDWAVAAGASFVCVQPDLWQRIRTEIDWRRYNDLLRTNAATPAPTPTSTPTPSPTPTPTPRPLRCECTCWPQEAPP